MTDREKVMEGLRHCADRTMEMCNQTCPYYRMASCETELAADALEMLRELKAVADELIRVGYPHNFQHEAPWVAQSCRDITEVIKKAYEVA